MFKLPEDYRPCQVNYPPKLSQDVLNFCLEYAIADQVAALLYTNISMFRKSKIQRHARY